MTASDSSTAPIDLAGHAIMQSHARSSKSAQMMAFLMRIDGVDTWAVDYREDEAPNVFEIKAFINQLQSFLNAGGMDRLQAVNQQDAVRGFLDLLGGMRSSRCLYLLREVSARNPELFGRIVSLIFEAAPTEQQDRLALVVRRRYEAFDKAKLLGEIFSTRQLERIKSIMKERLV